MTNLYQLTADALVIVTGTAEYVIKNDSVVKTALTGTNYGEPLPWDTTVQGMLDNAKQSAKMQCTASEIELLMDLAQEKIEGFE